MTNQNFSYQLDFSKVKSIFLVIQPVDLRKGIDGYVSIVQNDLALNPIDGSLFFFTNRQKNKVKGLLYNGNGWWLIYWRLSRSSLSWPSLYEAPCLEVSLQELKTLFSGLSILPNPAFQPQFPKYL